MSRAPAGSRSAGQLVCVRSGMRGLEVRHGTWSGSGAECEEEVDAPEGALWRTMVAVMMVEGKGEGAVVV